MESPNETDTDVISISQKWPRQQMSQTSGMISDVGFFYFVYKSHIIFIVNPEKKSWCYHWLLVTICYW